MATDIKPLPEQVMFQPFFDLVKSPVNWKFPIDCEREAPVGNTDFDLWCRMMRRAIEFYAGGGAEITEPDPPNVANNVRTVRVRAPGYYALIGS